MWLVRSSVVMDPEWAWQGLAQAPNNAQLRFNKCSTLTISYAGLSLCAMSLWYQVKMLYILLKEHARRIKTRFFIT